MKMRKLKGSLAAAAVAVAIVGGASAANAAVVFFDDFEGYPGQVLNADLAPNWTSSGGGIDLIGVGTAWNLVPGENDTHYVDLDGSTGQPGVLSAKTFAAGTYTLSFDLAGQNRSYDTLTKTVTISLGDWMTTLSPVWNAAFATYTYTFTTTGGSLSFAESSGGNNNVGDLLDNVSLSSAVPEASTWAMLVAGFAGLGFAAFRKSSKAPVAIA
jgi:hypothetical protein